MRDGNIAGAEPSKVMKASEPRPKMIHRAVFQWSQSMLVRRDSVDIMGRSVVKIGQLVWVLGLDLVLQFELRS